MGKLITAVAVESNQVTLLNGAIIEARVVHSKLSYLRVMLDADPRGQELIQDLFLIAEGKADEAHTKNLEYFAHNRVLSSPEGILFPEVREIMISAFRRVGDGIVLVEPYQATEANRAALVAAEIEFSDMMRKHFLPRSGGGGGGLPGL
jgi:hypothetical protein